MNELNNASPAKQGTASAQPPDNTTAPPGFLDFAGLLAVVPLGERTLREEIKKGRIPAIRLPGGRRLLFFYPSVEAALLRFSKGGIE